LADSGQHPLLIGNSAGMSQASDGLIDEVRVCNVVPSEHEIAAWMRTYLDGTGFDCVPIGG
jgi:hypothetical protein